MTDKMYRKFRGLSDQQIGVGITQLFTRTTDLHARLAAVEGLLKGMLEEIGPGDLPKADMPALPADPVVEP